MDFIKNDRCHEKNKGQRKPKKEPDPQKKKAKAKGKGKGKSKGQPIQSRGQTAGPGGRISPTHSGGQKKEPNTKVQETGWVDQPVKT